MSYSHKPKAVVVHDMLPVENAKWYHLSKPIEKNSMVLNYTIGFGLSCDFFFVHFTPYIYIYSSIVRIKEQLLDIST